MLDYIQIESYRTLRNTAVSFKDGLNIIIGMNGVGKSNLLGFIGNIPMTTILRRYWSKKSRQPNTSYDFTLKFTDQRNQVNKFEFIIETKKPVLAAKDDEDDANFKVKFTRLLNDVIVENGVDTKELEVNKRHDLELLLRRGQTFQGAHVTFTMPQDIPYLSSSKTLVLEKSGALIDYFFYPLRFLTNFEIDFVFEGLNKEMIGDSVLVKKSIDQFFNTCIEEIGLNNYLSAYTNIEEVRLNKNTNVYITDTNLIVENLVLEFRIDGTWVPWSYLSDGTKRSFYLIAEVANASNELILIEEPEIGQHPFQLHKIMTFLKEQSRTKQIILSTHSPEVLNVLAPDELDQILIASINKGVTSFRNLTDDQQEKARTYMNEVGDLSSYWLHSDLENND